MKTSRLQTSLTAVVLLLAILACVLPGQSVSQPVPTADTVLLGTMVAETFSAAVEQTAFVASVLLTPTPPPPTETPTTEISPSGSSLTKQADGTTLFIDERSGFEATVPAGWLALRVNEQEYFEAWTLAEASDPAIQKSLTTIQNQNPDQFRLFALDTQDGHIQGGFVTNINFVWDEHHEMSLENDVDLKALAATLPNGIPGIEVQTTEISSTASGIPFGIITSKWQGKTSDGVDLTINQKQVFFSLKAGTMALTFTTTEGLKDIVLPAFDAMIETIQVSK